MRRFTMDKLLFEVKINIQPYPATSQISFYHSVAFPWSHVILAIW